MPWTPIDPAAAAKGKGKGKGKKSLRKAAAAVAAALAAAELAATLPGAAATAGPLERKHQICWHFEQHGAGGCHRGDTCTFAHGPPGTLSPACLLYTSDAADE